MHKLLKVLFPFRAKHTYLRAYWWHRLFVVIFFIALSVLAYLILVAYGECVDQRLHYSSDRGALFDCNIKSNIIMLIFGLLWSNTPFVPESIVTVLYFLNSSVIFSISTAILTASYVFQTIYYKALIYIIFGQEIRNTG